MNTYLNKIFIEEILNENEDKKTISIEKNTKGIKIIKDMEELIKLLKNEMQGNEGKILPHAPGKIPGRLKQIEEQIENLKKLYEIKSGE